MTVIAIMLMKKEYAADDDNYNDDIDDLHDEREGETDDEKEYDEKRIGRIKNMMMPILGEDDERGRRRRREKRRVRKGGESQHASKGYRPFVTRMIYATQKPNSDLLLS